MAQLDLGANHFTFQGDRTNIVYYTQRSGPIMAGEDFSGGQLDYQGPESKRTFFGKDIALQSSHLGTLLTVMLKIKDDTGGITLTILIPQVSVNAGNTLTFETMALQTSSRGSIEGEGPELTYTILPLLATANRVILAL